MTKKPDGSEEPAGAASETDASKRNWLRRLAFLGGGAFFLVGLFTSVEPFQQRICSLSPIVELQKGPGTPRELTRTVCFHKSSWSAGPDEVESLADDFLAGAGGEPSNALAYVTPEFLELRDRADFVAAWSPVVWAERVGSVSKASRNTYAVEYREFNGEGSVPPDGLVKTLTMEMEVSLADGEPRVQGIEDIQRTEPDENRSYAQDFTTIATSTRLAPSVDARPAQGLGAKDTVRLLCVLEIHGEPWARTTDGWLPGAELRSKGQPEQSVAQCDPHHAN